MPSTCARCCARRTSSPRARRCSPSCSSSRPTASASGFVVDEYGELQGLVAIEDIIEEIVGDFTTAAPGSETFGRDASGSVTVDGMTPLRLLNRRLGTDFPLEGPKTLNGLIVEQLGEIPDAGTRVRVAGQAMEILQTQDRAIKVVRLLPPVGRAAAPPLQSNDVRASSTR